MAYTGPSALESMLYGAPQQPSAQVSSPSTPLAPVGPGKTDPNKSGTATMLGKAKRLPSGLWQVEGLPNAINDKAFQAMIEQQVQTDLAQGDTIDGLKPFLDKAGVKFSSEGGTFRVTGVPQAGGGVSVAPPPTAPGLQPAAAPSSPGGAGGSGGGGGGYGGGGGTALPSAGSGGKTSGGIPWGGGGGGGGGTTMVGSSGPGSSNGLTSIDPNKPLGLNPGGGAPAGFQAGSQGQAGVFGSPGSILQGLGSGSTLNDVIMNIVKRQEGNRDAALSTYGGALKTAENDPVLQGSRSRALDVLQNPYSLDDPTVSRIMGSQGDLIGQNTARLKQGYNDRAAANGMGRSGITAAQNDRFDINAVKSLGDAQRGLLIEQATRKPKELQASLASASDFGSRDVAQRTGIATGAADSIYGQTSIMGDALLSGVLMGGQGAKPQEQQQPQYGGIWAGGGGSQFTIR